MVLGFLMPCVFSWEVFYAPHIANLSSQLGARFEPIAYTLKGAKLLSNVKYAHPLLGEGWLNAGGETRQDMPQDTRLDMQKK